MKHHYNTPDRHASERERKRRKQRYGMRVTGRSVRLLSRLQPSSSSRRPKKK